MGSSIVDRLKQLRKGAGLTQLELAERISVSRESVGKWESRKNNTIPKMEDVIALADYYGVSCDYILRGVTPERLMIVRELGLSDMAIQEMQNLKKSSYKSYGLLSALFDHQHGAIWYILDCVDKAIDTRALQMMEQKRINDNDELDEPMIQIGNGAEIEYDMVIRAMVREASEAFMQNTQMYVNEEATKYATQNHS